jgi:hypothetical protein
MHIYIPPETRTYFMIARNLGGRSPTKLEKQINERKIINTKRRGAFPGYYQGEREKENSR